MKKSGAWYLEYTNYEAMESLGNEIEEVRIPFKRRQKAGREWKQK